MGKVLIIGAGGVGTVVAHKVAQNPDVFTEIVLASRTKSKCDAIAKAIGSDRIITDQVDADNVNELIKLFNTHKPDIVINVALPYQDLTIMDACLACGVNYLDTANYEPLDEAKFEYKWQWAYQERFKKAGLTAILGCGFDPGVSGVYTAYAAKLYLKKCTIWILSIAMPEIMVKLLRQTLIRKLIFGRLRKRENIMKTANGFIQSLMKFINR